MNDFNKNYESFEVECIILYQCNIGTCVNSRYSYIVLNLMLTQACNRNVLNYHSLYWNMFPEKYFIFNCTSYSMFLFS